MSEKQFRDYFIRKLGGYSILKMAKFNESTNKYDSDSLCDYTLGFLDGSLVTFQEQQKRIEELESKLKATDALGRMRAAVIGAYKTQGLDARTKRKMLILKKAEQKLKGGDE